MDLGELEKWRENKAAQGGLPGDVWSSVSAFANTNGGLIVLGVKENMKTRELRVLGVPDAQKMLEDFTNAANSADKLSYPVFSDEHLGIEDIGGKEVVVIEVPRVGRRHRPVYEGKDIFAGTYRRKFTGDYHCGREEVAGMLRDSAEEPLDLEPAEHSKLSDLDFETVRSYRTSYNIHHAGGAWTKLPDDQFLCRIGAADELDDGTVVPTRAGVLMFGQEWKIVHDFPNYFLDYREQRGSNRRWEDRFTSQDPEWSGNVFDFYERVYNRLKQALKVPFNLDGIYRVEDTPAHEALREALANMLTNADYGASRPVVCRWTDEGIEFANPGGFRVGIEQAFRGGTSDARNKTMLKMFTMIEVGERAGSGVPNMLEQWASCGYSNPRLEERVDPEVSTVFLPLDAGLQGSGKVEAEIPDGLTDREAMAYAIAAERGRVTTKALVDASGASRQTASDTLKGLAARGVLSWHGRSANDPSQYYTVQ